MCMYGILYSQLFRNERRLYLTQVLHPKLPVKIRFLFSS
jgi:hypothetical protein